jgi:cardiolipin synthase
MLIITLFWPSGENSSGMLLSYPALPNSPEFIEGLSNVLNVPIEHGQTVTPIDEGEQFLPLLITAINNASSTIDLTTYPWSSGTMSDEVISALTSAAKRGVSVRILIDALGGHTVSDSDLSQLRNAGAKIERYHSFSLLNPLQYDERDHMRAIVFDGKIGFVGGMGIGDDWLGDGVTSGWSDEMFEVTGSMAESLQNDFAALWNQSTSEVLAGPTFYPPLTSASTTANSYANTYLNIVSIPSENLEPIRDTFLYSIMNAQKSIYIISPFIIPDTDIVNALEDKSRSGVDVEIISPGPKTNAPLLRSAWEADYAGLLAAGVKIYEYAPQMIHTKIMVVDDNWSVIGSANLDSRSEVLNDENVMGIQDPVLATQLQQLFETDISNSNQITETQWNSTSFLVKWWGDFIQLFAKQF